MFAAAAMSCPHERCSVLCYGLLLNGTWPALLLQGLLWVWMDSNAGAISASQQRPLPLPAELVSAPGEAPRGVLLGDWCASLQGGQIGAPLRYHQQAPLQPHCEHS